MLSDGEMMIYAAAFAAEYREVTKSPPYALLLPGMDQEWRKWEVDQAARAAENAFGVVRRFRSMRNALADGYGMNSEEFHAYEAMSGKRWRDG